MPMINRILAACVALLAVLTIGVAHAFAATRPVTRPVSLAAVSSCDAQGYWTVTVAVRSVKAQVVYLYDTAYENRLIDKSVALQPGVLYVMSYRPGSSFQYVEIGAFRPGSGGWDQGSDPLASARVDDPANKYPQPTSC